MFAEHFLLKRVLTQPPPGLCFRLPFGPIPLVCDWTPQLLFWLNMIGCRLMHRKLM